MEKKTKLTISGNTKKSFKKFDTTSVQGKKTVVIDKNNSRSSGRGNFNKQSTFKSSSSSNFKRGAPFKSNFSSKTSTTTSDFERRKLAEQRATKRLKSEIESKSRKESKIDIRNESESKVRMRVKAKL